MMMSGGERPADGSTFPIYAVSALADPKDPPPPPAARQYYASPPIAHVIRHGYLLDTPPKKWLPTTSSLLHGNLFGRAM